MGAEKSFKFEEAAARFEGFKTFIEWIDINDVDFTHENMDGIEVHQSLRDCYKDEGCRLNNLYMDKIPINDVDVDGLLVVGCIETWQRAIRTVRRCDGKLIPVEGKHRLLLAKELGIKRVPATVEYDSPCRR